MRVSDAILKKKLTSSKDNDVGGVVVSRNSWQLSGIHALGL
jgi:hypothetical protein